MNSVVIFRAPKKIKKISISKKTGMPIVEKEMYFFHLLIDLFIREEKEEDEEEEEDVEMVEVENDGERRNKKETAEEKRLRKQKVKEMKSV